MFFSTLRNAVRLRRDAEADRDFWKQRALAYESKLEARSDFYIEREFRLMDRFLTSQVKVPAITDEIRSHSPTDQEVTDHAREAYLQDVKEGLVHYAREAGKSDPEGEAARTFEQNYSRYVNDFEMQRIN